MAKQGHERVQRISTLGVVLYCTFVAVLIEVEQLNASGILEILPDSVKEKVGLGIGAEGDPTQSRGEEE